MRLPRLRGRGQAPIEVADGERVLAWCATADGEVVAGTRVAIYLPTGRVPWEQVEAADWDTDSAELRVSEVGTWGEQRPEHTFTVEEPGRFAELLRERVTASVVVQRHVPVAGSRGVRVIARREPSGERRIRWFFSYDEGVDPDDPDVRAAAAEALAAARADLGQ